MVAALGIALAEIPDWNCCGASSGHIANHDAGRGPAGAQPGARRGAGLRPRAGALRRLLQPPRSSRTRRCRRTRTSPAACPTSSAGRSPTRSTCISVDAAAARRARATSRRASPPPPSRSNLMGGVKLASYYGCLLVRPASVAGGDDVEQPMFMDDVVAACGADPVDWNMKVECCGGAYGVSRTSSVVRLGRAIVEDARKQRRRGHRRRLPALPDQPGPAAEGDGVARSPAAARPLHHRDRRPRARPARPRSSASSGTGSTRSRGCATCRRAPSSAPRTPERPRRRRPPRPPRGRPRRPRPRRPPPRPQPAAPDAGGDA